MDKGRDKSDT